MRLDFLEGGTWHVVVGEAFSQDITFEVFWFSILNVIGIVIGIVILIVIMLCRCWQGIQPGCHFWGVLRFCLCFCNSNCNWYCCYILLFIAIFLVVSSSIAMSIYEFSPDFVSGGKPYPGIWLDLYLSSFLDASASLAPTQVSWSLSQSVTDFHSVDVSGFSWIFCKP